MGVSINYVSVDTLGLIPRTTMILHWDCHSKKKKKKTIYAALYCGMALATKHRLDYSYILMKDVFAEKAVGSSRPKTVPLERGELLTSVHIPAPPLNSQNRASRKFGKPTPNFCSKKDPSITWYGEDQDVIPLVGKESQLLEGIENLSDRYGVFRDEKLDWGCGLQTGAQVYVMIPSSNPLKVFTWSKACVQYIGPVEGLPGWNFGVEIKVNRCPDDNFCMFLHSRHA